MDAAKEYHRKTTGPHQMWATDASYFRVVGWGYYYPVTVMAEFVYYYNYRRHHKALSNVTPDDVLQGRWDSTLARGKEMQSQTLKRRQLQNQQIRQLRKSSSLAVLSAKKVPHFC